MLTAAALFLTCCAVVPREPAVAPDEVPRLGQKLAGVGPSGTMTLASPSQFWPSYEAIAGGKRFTVGFDDDMRVRFVSTSDRSFRSPEGLKVGDSVSDAVRVGKREPMQERGWGHYVQLPSGWFALVAADFVDEAGKVHLNLGTAPLGDNARITMFFMRD